MGYPRFIGTVIKNQFILQGEEFHHAKVRRIKEKQKIEINDLKGNVYLGIVTNVEKRAVKGKILEKIHVVEGKLCINLLLGMPNKLSKIDKLIPSITELGVKRFIPVITKNTAVKEKDIIKKISKWEKISLNSIKQCGRLFPIQIEKPVSLSEISPSSPVRIVFFEKEKKRTVKDINVQTDSVDVFIGAEGGIAETEIISLKEKGFETYSLGPYTLRMETAVIASISQINIQLASLV